MDDLEFEVSDEDYEWLKAEADAQGISVEDLIVKVIEEFLNERENDESV